MKIKKITVDSFGKLKNKTVELSDGINVIKGENESGKSSLARFIRFMLYGFTSRNTDISKNDKKKYQPWDGSACKGSLDLSAGTEAYTLRREQAARASQSITDSSGVPVFKGEVPGEVFLGVDEDTYDKTALISAGDVYFDDAVSLSSAIKNMVFSADSAVDSDVALKKLETLRKSILGKTERSGRLHEARLEMSELVQNKSILAEAHKELLVAETMLKKIKANIEKNNAAIDTLKKERHNIEAYEATLKIKRAEELLEKAEESKAKYENKCAEMTIDGFLPDREFLSQMNEGLLDLRASEAELEQAKKEHEYSEEMLKNCYSDTKQFAFNSSLSDAGKTAKELKSDLDLLKEQLKSKKKIALILTLLVITLPIAVFFWISCSKIGKQLEKLCESFGCADIEEFERLLGNSESSGTLSAAAKLRVDKAKQNLENAYEKRGDIAERLRRLLEKCGFRESISDTVILAETVKKQIKTLSFFVDELEEMDKAMTVDRASYDGFMGTVGDYGALKELAESYDESIPLRESAKNAKELDFYLRATEGLLVQERDYEKKAAVIASNMEKPDELQAKISALEKEISDLEKQHAAIIMAENAIEAAHDSMRGNVSPILTEKASEMFSKMTGGKYKGLYVDNELKLSFLEEGSSEYKSVDYLSTGAADAAYIALRITLTQYLYKENPVLIFDDAFSRLDDTRLKSVCEMLEAIASEYQIIVLTCHDREVAMLKSGKIIKM